MWTFWLTLFGGAIQTRQTKTITQNELAKQTFIPASLYSILFLHYTSLVLEAYRQLTVNKTWCQVNCQQRPSLHQAGHWICSQISHSH